MFEEIIGHQNQIKNLKDTLKKDTISHAYLFVGSKGIGKASIAFEFAKGILQVENLKASPDFKYICKNEDKKEIIVEQIRKEIIDDIYIAPIASSKKVYIIDDAQDLNIASQNALLKTLEEPPKYVVIILISTTTSSFLSTILSRVNQISFSNIEKEEFDKYLFKKFNVTLSDSIINFLDGSIGKANMIIENNMLEKLNQIDKLYNYLEKKDSVNSLMLSSDIDFSNSINLEYIEYLLYSNFKYSCVKFVEKARNRLKNNGNYDIVIDSMILRIIDHI